MDVYIADIKVQFNCGMPFQVWDKKKGKWLSSKTRLAVPEFEIVKQVCVNTLSIEELNVTHISRVYRDLKYSPTELEKAKRNGRVKIVDITNIQGPMGLEWKGRKAKV